MIYEYKNTQNTSTTTTTNNPLMHMENWHLVLTFFILNCFMNKSTLLNKRKTVVFNKLNFSMGDLSVSNISGHLKS